MTNWRKSSYSFSNGNCAEVASWRTSSRSIGTECVEAGNGTAAVGVRDSVLGDTSPVLRFNFRTWTAFLAAVKQPASAPHRARGAALPCCEP